MMASQDLVILIFVFQSKTQKNKPRQQQQKTREEYLHKGKKNQFP